MPQNILKSPTWIISAVAIVAVLIAGVVVGVYMSGGPTPILAGNENTKQPKVNPTQIYLLRHAEQTPDKRDLTLEGQARAQLLAERLTRARITYVCSSHLNRAFRTVEPLAANHELSVDQIPEPGSILDGEVVDESTPSRASIEPMVEALRDLPPGSVAVCAGHSGTLLAMMAGLGVDVDPDCDFPRDNCVPGTEKSDFPGGWSGIYDDLWVVIPTVASSTKGRPEASLVNLRFGNPNP